MPKLCCIDCFEPKSIKKFIKNNGIGRNFCYFCDDYSPHCIEPSDLVDLFRPIVNLYSRIEEFMPLELMKEFEGQTLSEKLIEDWAPFANDDFEHVSELLGEIFDDGSRDPFEDDGIDFESWVENPDFYWGTDDEPSKNLKKEWEEFCSEIKGRNRYFPQKSVNLDYISNISYLKKEVPVGIYYYRARKSENKKRIQPKNMGMPPASLSTSGRANPKGIPYLYIATDCNTAIHEVRPSTTEFVTVGKFKVLETMIILDLSNQKEFDPYLCGDELYSILNLLGFFYMLGNELSRPIDPLEKELHYIPTQYLCEFIKNKGFDGVAYKSNVGSGVNIALFSNSKVKCTRTTLYDIEAKAHIIKA